MYKVPRKTRIPFSTTPYTCTLALNIVTKKRIRLAQHPNDTQTITFSHNAADTLEYYSPTTPRNYSIGGLLKA